MVTAQSAPIAGPIPFLTKNSDINVLCKEDEALVLDAQNRILAVFKKKGGLYVANMKVRNPKYKLPFGRQAR